MEYRCKVISMDGLVQYLAANLLPSGYWFYVTGHVPEGKPAELIDGKLIAKYGIAISRQARCRRRHAGVASVRYLRCGRFFLLLATHGVHAFFQEEASLVRDIRRVPLVVADYSISYRPGRYRRRTPGCQAERDDRWHPRVRISQARYRELKQHFLEKATHWTIDRLKGEFQGLPFEPYAPVRQQLLNLLRLVNKARHAAGQERLPSSVLRYRRRIVSPLTSVTSGDKERTPL
jgi:hypothetical protein